LSKAEIFDCVLAVTAKENSIDIIFTENIADFKHYKFIKVLNPFV
jgi:predicted nucleic acid-binding protein